MNLKDFESYIDEKILSRGFDYYEGGAVKDLTEKKKNEWSAVVEGSELYRVRVNLEKEDIVYSECDCPYDMGPVCKHQVAVYYALRNDKYEAEESSGKAREEDLESRIKKIINKMEKEELIQIITDRAVQDDAFSNYLIAAYEITDEAAGKTYYKKIIRSCVNAAKDRHGFINYYRAPEAAGGAFRLLNSAETALQRREYDRAIAIAQAVIEVMATTFEYTDDSDGDAGFSIETAFKILHGAAACGLPEKTRKTLLTYCLKESEKKIYNQYGNWLFDFLGIAAGISVSDQEINRMLGKIEEYITAYREEAYSSYTSEKLSIMKYDLLLKLKRDTEAEEFFSNCMHFPDFRRRALGRAFETGDYDLVIRLAKEGEKKDSEKSLWGLVNEWKVWRINAYQAKNDNEGTVELAFDLVVNEDRTEYFEVYKKHIENKKWPDAYEKLKAALKGKNKHYFSRTLADILVKEKEFPLLLEMLRESPGSVELYQQYFLRSHPGEIYGLHVINIKEHAKRANDRKAYKRVCGSIKDLRKLGGNKEAEYLINEFSEEYKHRPAFTDELSKI